MRRKRIPIKFNQYSYLVFNLSNYAPKIHTDTEYLSQAHDRGGRRPPNEPPSSALSMSRTPGDTCTCSLQVFLFFCRLEFFPFQERWGIIDQMQTRKSTSKGKHESSTVVGHGQHPVRNVIGGSKHSE